MKRIRPGAFRLTTRPSLTHKTSTPEHAWKRRSARVRVVRRPRPRLKRPVLLMECQRLESFVRQGRHLHGDGDAVAPRTGDGLTGGVVDGVAEGDAAGAAADDFGEAAGEADEPGWVDGSTAGGFTAAAG